MEDKKSAPTVKRHIHKTVGMPLVCVVMELYGRKKSFHLTSLPKSDNSTQHILNALKHQTAEMCEKRK